MIVSERNTESQNEKVRKKIMKKQYSYKEVYSDNYEVTTYIDGIKEGSNIVALYEFSGYKERLECEGYELCYAPEEISECIEGFKYYKDLLEAMKKDPLVGCENMFTDDM
jgi:hypothetical protein